MKRLTLLMTLAAATTGAFLLQAQSKAPKNNKPDGEFDVQLNAADERASTMLGTYGGQFGDTKMTLSLDRIVAKTVMGYSIVQGNERAFSGSWDYDNGQIKILAKEPGDHKEDGVYRLTFNVDAKTLLGNWVANDKKIPSVDLSLTSKPFKYSAKVGTYPQSSTKMLKEKDVENMRPAELRIMRNEIYARHGYCFRLDDMRKHFNAQDWYMPLAVDIKTSLTETEKKNEQLIKRYEGYTQEYYDKFGR